MKILEKKTLTSINGGVWKSEVWPDGSGYTSCRYSSYWDATECHSAKFDGSWSGNGIFH